MGGTGSTKMIYQQGIPFFDHLKESSTELDFVNFELHPNGLILRLSKKDQRRGFILFKKDIRHIKFETFKIKVRWKNHTKIVLEAHITFSLQDGQHVAFHAPTVFYKPSKKYFSKDWLQEIVTFVDSPLEPREDSNGQYISFLQTLARLS